MVPDQRSAVVVLYADADHAVAERIGELISAPFRRTAVEGDKTLIVVLSPELAKDARLLSQAEHGADEQVRLIPVATQGGLDEITAFESLKSLHWIEVFRLDDDALRDVLLQAMNLNSDTAADLDVLSSAARAWHAQGRPLRAAFAGSELVRKQTLWDSLTAGHPVFGNEIVADFLTAGALRQKRRRRISRWTGTVLAAVVLIGCGGWGWQLVRERSASASAASAEQDRLSVQAAKTARDDLSAGRRRDALIEADGALDHASTRDAREVGREILSLPLPSTTFQLGAVKPAAMAWSRSGRYLAAGSSDGRLWVLDTRDRKRVVRRAVGRSAIRSLGFRVANTGAEVVYTLGDGTRGAAPVPLAAAEGGSDGSRVDRTATVSSDESASASLFHDGVAFRSTRCANKANSACTVWGPVTSGSTLGGLWNPHEALLAVATTGGDVDVFDAGRVLARSTTLTPRRLSGKGGWATYLPDTKRTAVVDADGAAYLAYPGEPSKGDERYACQTVHDTSSQNIGQAFNYRVSGLDCRGRVQWSVSDYDIAAALPPEAKGDAETASGEPSVEPVIEVGPRGTTALVVDRAGRAYLLRRTTTWTVALRTAVRLTPGLRVSGVVFTADGTAAAAMLRPEDGGAATVLVLDLKRPATAPFRIGAVSSSTDLDAFSADHRTLALSGNVSGSNEGVLIVDVTHRSISATRIGGRPVAFDETSRRLLVIGAPDSSLPLPRTLPFGVNTAMSSARVYDVQSGELLCQELFYQPGQPVGFVRPDLTSFIIDGFGPLYQQGCAPPAHLRGALKSALASIVPVARP